MASGRYTFEREIGRGASGAVYLGRDTLLGRDVALKRVGYVPGGTSAEEIRAEREARIAASLSHPHLVGVYDLVHEGDSYWLVMEYVEGNSLSALVTREGALSPERVTRLVGQIASAVAKVHTSGVVHRDVKPSNVLVRFPGTPQELAKLTDFGIARSEEDRALTKTGLVTGSPAYLSPEVVTGGRATQASDVWAIGATLFHLLAGHPPYESSENVLSTMFRIVNDPPPRIESDPVLTEVLARTMVLDPQMRWSADQVRDRLLGPPSRRSVHSVASTQLMPRIEPHSPPVAATVSGRDSGPLAPLATSRSDSSPSTSRAAVVSQRPVWHWVAVAAAVTVLSVSALLLGLNRDDGDDNATGPSAPAPVKAEKPRKTIATPTDQVTSAPPTSPSPTPTGTPTSAEVEEFARTYLVAAPNDPESAWNRLTPEFQSASGGYQGYVGWWGSVERAEPLEVSADASTLRVRYRVRYTLRDGRISTEVVALRLVQRDGALLIAGEG